MAGNETVCRLDVRKPSRPVKCSRSRRRQHDDDYDDDYEDEEPMPRKGKWAAGVSPWQARLAGYC